jgi:UDP-glucose 4-epimerase
MPGGLNGVPCLVLGGGGFLGRALIGALRREGAQVRGFGRLSRFEAPETSHPWIHADFADQMAVARAVEGIEIVFHLAAGSTPERSNSAPISDLEASVAGTIRLLELCSAAGVRRIIFASSGGAVYGIPEDLPIGETAPTRPISAYGANKVAVENYLFIHNYLYGLEHVILRISNPFGPYQDPLGRQGLIAATLLKLLMGEPTDIWGDGSVTRDYVFVDDVANAFVKAATYTGKHTIFNIGSGVGMTVDEVIDAAVQAMGVKHPGKIYRPGRKADVPVNILNVRRAHSDLRWSAETHWAEAISRTVAWMERESTVRALLKRGRNARA